MNKIKTTRALLSAVIAVAVVSLAACGGGSDTKSTAEVLPAGAVGTKGDSVNLAEYNAITCGMPRDQVLSIIADEPTYSLATSLIYILQGANAGLSVGLDFQNDLLKQKDIGNGKAAGQVDLVKC